MITIDDNMHSVCRDARSCVSTSCGVSSTPCASSCVSSVPSVSTPFIPSKNNVLYKNKFRIESIRMKDWNYSSDGFYFITICTKNRECALGHVSGGKILLSEIGKIVEAEWLKSFEIRTELFCDIYCIMPNHIHAIVVIDKNNEPTNIQNDIPIIVETQEVETQEVETQEVETHGCASLQPIRQKRSISSFVAGFKSSATKIINKSQNTLRIPVWQSRFYDHIIRNEKELHSVREYILNNPKHWDNDENNQCKSTRKNLYE